MRLALCAAVALALAGCDSPPPAGEPGGPIRSEQPPEQNSLDAEESSAPVVAGELPPISAGPRFVGQWAASRESCEASPWLFTETTLHTPAGSTCSFNRVTDVADGYDIQATCSAEAPPTSDTLKLRFDESSNAMRFQSETIADATLVFCGRVT